MGQVHVLDPRDIPEDWRRLLEAIGKARCSWIPAYRRRKDAAKAIRRMVAAVTCLGMLSMRPYRCPECRRWHVGNRGGSPRARRSAIS